ncbi:hypothetical protein LUX33_20125 [Actinomadura madurae]|uniref:hypothetical protein n=1 Tax=Actinomadura madurae TaxID=1993 RepID=UPI0020D2543D|nr:hypothetical protein [Actinomadura madurae]MCP9950486.1 hypothetical protein [Actinomadura madurae]MCP9967268.1 hypothetical protein [Actinomadura madurae]
MSTCCACALVSAGVPCGFPEAAEVEFPEQPGRRGGGEQAGYEDRNERAYGH